jgi:Rrf2 family protein
MKFELTSRSDYAVRAMICVARLDAGDRCKAREIAAMMEIPRTFVAQVLAKLVAAGLLDALAGPQGGYRLARPAAGISLLEIIEVAEGAVGQDTCILRGGPCDWEVTCPLHVTWHRASSRFTASLGELALADIVAIDFAIEAGEYELPPDAPPHTIPTARKGIR